MNKKEIVNLQIGIFRGSLKGFGFVKLEQSDEDIYIAIENTKNALNGDKVEIIILDKPKDEMHKEGKIINILKHEKDTIVGIFQKNKNFGFVVPDDKKLGTDIFIPKTKFGKARNNSKVLVKIIKFPKDGKNAEGEIIEVIGNVNEAGVDMLSLIKEHSLPYQFPESVIKEAENIKQSISNDEIKERLDLRDKEIFTIDGQDAKDLDDAICVEKTKNGTYILSVHIADVSYYVKQGSEIDKEAIIRGTSIYMMDRVVPMLPRELSNGICSLNAEKDRLALSVVIEINEKGNVISSDVFKSVIRVTKRMNYTDIATILKFTNNKLYTEEEKIIKEHEKYINHFKLMEELAQILKSKRLKEGSLDLDVPESKITLDKNGIAINVEKYELSFANEIIEQFMLTANEVIAEKFYWLEAPFIYRVHTEPDIEKINELNKFLYNLGYKIKANKENIHPKSFAEVLKQVKGKTENRVVSNLILRTLKVARYESENKGHFGIASKYYCHFTSPIRRYPDLFIHRIISKYIENRYNLSDDQLEIYSEQVGKIAENSSEREKVAQKVERDSVDIKKAEYMQSKIGEEYEGVISNITSFGVFVELENTVEGLIRFENLGDEYFEYDESRKILTGQHTKKIYRIGDKINIKVIEANKELRRISFSIN